MFTKRIYQYVATFSASSAVISFGINNGWTSPYLPYLLSNSSTIPTTPTEGSWCAVAPLAGCIIGALIAAMAADRLGRKITVLLLAPVTIVSFIAIAFVNHIWLLSICRLAIGISEGALYTTLPMYIGEIVDPDIRGFSSSLLSIFYFVGTLFINSIGPFTDIFYSSFVVSIFPIIHMVTFLFMPESPYHYIKIGKFVEADNSLKKLKGNNNNSQKDLELLKEFKANMAKGRFLDLFTICSNRKACFIFATLMLVSKTTGKVPVMFFTTIIFYESGSSIDPVFSVILYSIVEVMTVTTMGFLIDKLGKRSLIIVSAIGCSVTVFSLGMYFFLKDSGSPLCQYLNWLPITALILHNVSFSLGFGYCTMTYISELFPMTVKANAACLAEISSVTLGIIISQFFQVTYTNFGMAIPFISFSVTTALGSIVIYYILPETKGKSLEEIQEFLVKACEKKKVLIPK